MNEEILHVESVSLPPSSEYDEGFDAVDLALRRGEQCVIEVEGAQACPALADVCSGLIEPLSGVVRFMGRPWADYTADEAAMARSRIGRVFEHHAWVSNLDLDENITLAQRHHTRRPEADIHQEALDLMQRFGLEHLPAMRPALAGRHISLLAQWVRALLANPSLLLLEKPTEEASDAECEALLACMGERLQAGAAVVWLTSDPRILKTDLLQRSLRARVDHGRWSWLK